MGWHSRASTIDTPVQVNLDEELPPSMLRSQPSHVSPQLNMRADAVSAATAIGWIDSRALDWIAGIYLSGVLLMSLHCC